MRYIELKNLVLEKQLVPEQEYIIEDYPNFSIILKAKDVNVLYADGTTSNGLYIRYSLDSSLFSYISEYGYIYYMYNPELDIITTFDYIQYGEFKDISKLQYNTHVNGIYHLPQLKINDSSNLIIGNNNTGLIEKSSYITIGNNNTDLSILNSTGIKIGDNNTNIKCNNINDIVINDNNTEILPKSYSIIGCQNYKINFQGENSTIHNNCIDIDIASFNEVDNSKYVRITGDSRFNIIKNSNSINIEDSYSNELDTSKIIDINKTNNNKINTSSLEIKEKNPFQKFYSVDSTRVVKDINDYLYNRADCQATTLNTKLNNAPSVEISKQEYYITNKLWETVETANFDKYEVQIIPNSKNDYCVVVGGGEYTYGDKVRLYANVYNENRVFQYWEFYDENEKPINTVAENPYIFTITDNVNVLAVIKDKENII